MKAADNRVSVPQGSLLDKDCGNGSASDIKTGFNHITGRFSIGVCLEFQNLGLQQNHFKEFINPFACLGRYFDKNNISPPFLRQKIIFRELSHNSVGISSGFIHFVDGHHDRHACCL